MFELELSNLFHLLDSNCGSVPSGSFLIHHRKLKALDSPYKLILANVKNIDCFRLNSGQLYQSLISFYSCQICSPWNHRTRKTNAISLETLSLAIVGNIKHRIKITTIYSSSTFKTRFSKLQCLLPLFAFPRFL